MAPCRIRVRRTTVQMPIMPSLLTRIFVALLLLPGCSLSDDGTMMPGEGGGSGGASAGSPGTSGSGGAVATVGSTAATGGSSPGTAGVGDTNGGGAAGAAGSGGVSLGGQGGGAQGGMAGAAGMAGGSETGPLAGAPHVTPQNATSVPAMFGDTVAVPRKLTTTGTHHSGESR